MEFSRETIPDGTKFERVIIYFRNSQSELLSKEASLVREYIEES